MRHALMSVMLLVFLAPMAAATADRAPQPIQVASDRSRLFQGPSFDKSKSLDKQRAFLRKQGYTHAGLIDILAREAVDRSWGAAATRGERQVEAGDYAGAANTYGEILRTLHPDHLYARASVLEKQYAAYAKLGGQGSRLEAVKRQFMDNRRKICSIEAEGYAGMKGREYQARHQRAAACLKDLGVRPPARDVPQDTDRCSAQKRDQVSQNARVFFDLACRHNFRYSRAANYPYVDLAYYIKDEDGVVPVIRTGYENALYMALKQRLLYKDSYDPLPVNNLFMLTLIVTLESMRGQDQSRASIINVLDVLLTAHNVSRLLARPEQWAMNYPKTPAGQNRSRMDRARPIFEDLIGIRSIDQYPSFHQHTTKRRNFAHTDVTKEFFGDNGVFAFDSATRIANDGFAADHWNGGVHYYFWVGALVTWIGNDLSHGFGGATLGKLGAYSYEWWQKKLGGNGLRGELQLKHGFLPGTNSMKAFIGVLDELERLDPRFIAQ